MAAKKVTVELEAKTDKAISELEDLKKEINRLNDEVSKGNKQTEKGLKGVEKASEKTAKGVSSIGNALKAAGIGLAIAAFAKLTEVFNENQKVTDAFSTTFEALSLAFNDFFNFLDRNIGTVIDYFKGIFSDPKQAIVDFGIAIKNNITERFNSLLDTLGFLASAVKKVFSGDFAGAMDDVKKAGKESLDVLTGVNDTFDKATEILPNVVKGITDYAKSTVKAAKDTVELNKQAELAAVINQGLIEKYDRQAEQQRQIRDDEAKTIEERIAANNKLGEVLEEQEKLMLANVDLQIKAAQAQFDKNANQENEIALQEARNEKAAVLAQIEGFRSEQLININSLEREKADLLKEAEEEEIERKERLAELKEQEKEQMLDNLETVRSVAGEESKIGRAIFIAKQAMLVKEQIAEAKATLARITMRTAEASVDVAKGTASTAKVGFPQNVPLLIAFAAQAAGIIAAVSSAAGAAKSSVASFGGGGGGSAPAPTAPPAFNVVGEAPVNQLAQTISGQEQKPIKAFVVSSDVSTAQSLERNIVEGASI
tara:strand:- start:7521 stop:9146 length:1626 start_codon:yes stop_codon:yes gene_type:complete